MKSLCLSPSVSVPRFLTGSSGALMRFGVSVLVEVVAVAGVIAFKTAYFLSHFSY